MKRVFVCFYEAYPPASGAASVSYELAGHAGGESYLLQLGSRAGEQVINGNLTVITVKGDSNNRFKKLSALRGILAAFANKTHSLSPDVVVLEGASWVMYHWLLLQKIRSTCPNIKIVYHAHNVEYLLRKEKHGVFITGLTRWAEKRILNNADLSFAVSALDRQNFEKLYGVTTGILPNGVEPDKFDLVTDMDISNLKAAYGLNEKTVIFMGSYLYRPNREAIDFLVSSVMPKVIQDCPDAQVVILGGAVPYQEAWLINPGCVSHEEIPIFAKACTVGVAPIFTGSGTRLKILEYMAAGIPVVATAKGAEGLLVQNGRDIFIENGAGSFADRITSLLKDRRLADTIGGRGREVVNTHYSWKSLIRVLLAAGNSSKGSS